MKIHTTKQ